MTASAVAHTDVEDSVAAGHLLGEQLLTGLNGEQPDAVIVFAAPDYDAHSLLEALCSVCQPGVLTGCSSAGEFSSSDPHINSAVAIALRSDEMTFKLAVGHRISVDPTAAALALAKELTGTRSQVYAYHTALLLADALAANTDAIIEQLAITTGGTYQFAGGGAGDNARFEHTPVFSGTSVLEDAVVALEILSNKPIGIGVQHGWQPATPGLRVTEVEGSRIISINATPAAEVFREYAHSTGQEFHSAEPMPFFLHNILGIDTYRGIKLRVPLRVHEDDSVSLAAPVPPGSVVRIMQTSSASAADAAAGAVRAALHQLDGRAPEIALFFDCVATRLRLGRDFGLELSSLQQSLGNVHFAGCNTHGQVARAEGQFSGFHNCTAVVCVIPQ